MFQLMIIFTCMLSNIGKLGLMVESTFQMLFISSIMLVVGARDGELLTLGCYFQEVKSLRVRHDLVDLKILCYQGNSSRIRRCFDQISPYLEKVEL